MSPQVIFNHVSELSEMWLDAKKRTRFEKPNLEMVNALYIIHLEQAEQAGYFPICPFEFSIAMLNIMKDCKDNLKSWDTFKQLATNELIQINEQKTATKQKKTA